MSDVVHRSEDQLERLLIQVQLNVEENDAILHDEEFCYFYGGMERLSTNNNDIYYLFNHLFTELEHGMNALNPVLN